MSLDKAISHGKEKRKPYRGSKAIDCTCRNHGSCGWCRQNRQIQSIKEREKMRIETTYYADDGTEFETEAECLAYEKKLDGLWDSILMLDEEFHGPKPGISAVEFAEGFAIYIKVLNAERAGELFNWLYEQIGTQMPPVDMIYDGGVFKYDATAKEDWVDLTERLREVTVEMDTIEKAVNSLG